MILALGFKLCRALNLGIGLCMKRSPPGFKPGVYRTHLFLKKSLNIFLQFYYINTIAVDVHLFRLLGSPFVFLSPSAPVSWVSKSRHSTSRIHRSEYVERVVLVARFSLNGYKPCRALTWSLHVICPGVQTWD